MATKTLTEQEFTEKMRLSLEKFKNSRDYFIDVVSSFRDRFAKELKNQGVLFDLEEFVRMFNGFIFRHEIQLLNLELEGSNLNVAFKYPAE